MTGDSNGCEAKNSQIIRLLSLCEGHEMELFYAKTIDVDSKLQ